MNELLLILSLIIIFGAVLLGYYLFGRSGLYCVSAVATVFANIEVLILIKAFGMEQTLGNVLFAATFLTTDILSECEGKREANKAVVIGVFAQIFFLVLSQSWLLYKPSEQDTAMGAISQIVSSTPRMILAVWLYHAWWKFTEKKTGDRRRFLWLRNNGSTLVSQIINTFLFTVIAFAGTYDFKTLMSIFGSSYVIYIFTSLLDTPVVYLARMMHDRKIKKLSLPKAE